MAKAKERELARKLRSNGCSLNEICEQVTAAKSTVSVWVRDIAITNEQLYRLGNKTDRGKFSRTMCAKREARHAEIQALADKEYETLSQSPAFMFGLALYVGEGTKAVPGKIALTNCNPYVMCKAVRFFENIGIGRSKMRCSIQLHPGIPEEPVLAFWQSTLGFSSAQFLPVYQKVSRASMDRAGHKQPYGVCQVYTCSTVTWHKLTHWMTLALRENTGG